MTQTLTIWHNPRCSKSRQTLALLQEHGHAPTVVEYLKAPPTEAEIRAALTSLGLAAHDIIRRTEAPYKDLGLSPQSPEPELIAAMAAQPILIGRPIVFGPGGAAIGRPPEAVLAVVRS